MARPTISLQAAIGPGSPVTNPFIIGTSLIDGTDVIVGQEIIGNGSFQEIGDRCYRVATRRGRQRIFEQFNAGTLTATFDNADGDLDPANTTGPYTDSGETRIAPMVAIDLKATYLGFEYPIYFGYADWWRPNPEYPEGGKVDMAATDAFKIFTRIDPLEQSAVGAGDTSGERIERILDLAEWSTSLRDVENGVATHDSTTMAEPIATQLRLTADSDRGQLWISEDGKVTFKARLHRYTDAQSITSQWPIGDGASMFNPTSVTPITDDQTNYNDVNVARVGGTVQTRRSATAELYPYERRSYNRTDLTLADDLQVITYAEEVLRVGDAMRRYRVESVTFDVDGDDTLWPFILGARFGDRCTVSLTHSGSAVVFTGDYFIEGIDHDIGVMESGGKWITTFYLADASPFPTHPFIIGTSLIDGTDVIV